MIKKNDHFPPPPFFSGLSDAYLSVIKALQHACLAANRRLDLVWVDAEKLEPATDAGERGAAWAALKGADAVLVPGGFGGRGVEGKILAAHHARTTNTPYLGICLGMQLAVIEYARNVLGLKDANSAEFDAATPHPTVVFMPEGSTTHKGGTMRLGSRRTVLETVDCIAAKLYQVSGMRGGREERGWVKKKKLDRSISNQSFSSSSPPFFYSTGGTIH